MFISEKEKKQNTLKMEKVSISQEDITIINIWSSTVKQLNIIKPKLTTKTEMNRIIIIYGDFNTQLSTMDRILIRK